MLQSVSARTEPANAIGRWIEAARNGDGEGDREVRGQTLEACRPYLLRVADRELGDDLRSKLEASDLVQETFLEAHRDFGRFQGRTEGALRAWLRRILRNNLANQAEQYRRTAKRELSREVSLDDSAIQPLKAGLRTRIPSPCGQVLQRERATGIHRALERLPQHYRQVIEWRNRHRYSFQEIGQRLDSSSDAARKLWMRAILRLQSELRRVDAG